MKDGDISRIRHMLYYCDRVNNTVNRCQNSFDVFSKDWDFYNSISMSIMQIGECASGLSEEFRNDTKNSIPWGLVRAMRNMFAHEYYVMDKETIWETATHDIPLVAAFCRSLVS